KSELVRLGFALEQQERDVAAEQSAAFARHAFAEARRDRADAGNRHHPKRDAGDEDVEAAQAAAQLAQRIAQAEPERAAVACGFFRKAPQAVGDDAHEAATRLSVDASMRPERSRTTRSQRWASEVSCVTSTSVMPRSACLANRRSTICFPVASSRLPVGSSATRMAGSGASARASATRCCSPPESCEG